MVSQSMRLAMQSVSLNVCVIEGFASCNVFIMLGFYHEQSRPDRDAYVEIIWDNIKEGMYLLHILCYHYNTTE
jgi:hypothetical protein